MYLNQEDVRSRWIFPAGGPSASKYVAPQDSAPSPLDSHLLQTEEGEGNIGRSRAGAVLEWGEVPMYSSRNFSAHKLSNKCRITLIFELL